MTEEGVAIAIMAILAELRWSVARLGRKVDDLDAGKLDKSAAPGVVKRTLSGMRSPAALLFVVGLAVLFAGCSSTRETQTEERRDVTRRTIEKKQVITHDGQVVELTTTTTATEKERRAGDVNEATETTPPRVLMELAKGAAVAVAGPAAPVVKAGLDWLEVAMYGGAAVAATATGTHVVTSRSKRRRKPEPDPDQEVVA